MCLLVILFSVVYALNRDLKKRISTSRDFLKKNLHTVHLLLHKANNMCLLHIPDMLISRDVFQ